MTCTGSLCDGGVIGGGLTVLAGVIAYRGARNAADRQIKDAQTARNESDRRRLNVVEWAVRAEGSRLRAEIDARHRALPSKAQFAARRVEQLVIESSPLLRGQREDMALLDIEPRRCLEEISSALDEYNAQIRTAPRGNADQPNISQTALDLIVHLGELAAALRAGWDHRSRIRRASRPVCVEVDSTALNCGHVCLVADNPLVPPPAMRRDGHGVGRAPAGRFVRSSPPSRPRAVHPAAARPSRLPAAILRAQVRSTSVRILPRHSPSTATRRSPRFRRPHDAVTTPTQPT